MHPAEVDAEYLRSVWRPDSVHAAAYRDWESIQLWANEYATQAEEPNGRIGEPAVAAMAEDVL
jgi:hypothetical protein